MAQDTVVLEGDVLDYWKTNSEWIRILLEESNTQDSLTISHNDLKFLTDEEWAMFKHWVPILPQYPGSVYIKNTMENLQRGYSDDPFKQMLAAIGYIPPGQVLERPRAPILTNGNMGEYSAERIAKGAITRKQKKEALRKAKARYERLDKMYREYYGNNYSNNWSILNSIPEPNWIKYQNNNLYTPNNEYANITRQVKLRLKNTQTRRRGRERLPNRRIDTHQRWKNQRKNMKQTQRLKLQRNKRHPR